MNKEVPAHTTFSSVVSRESVRLSFLLATINGLDLLMGDISNAYLHAEPREKVHVQVGPELFGPSSEGQTAIIVKALYGLKSSGAAWRYHFSTYLRNHLKFKATSADPDVYFKKMIRKNGTKYYAYILVYVDDILVINEEPSSTLKEIKETFIVKKDSIKYPDVYLGMDIRKRTDKQTGKEYMLTGSNTYTKRAIDTIKTQMKQDGLTFNNNPKQPFSVVAYRAELDSSPFCNDIKSVYYMQLIGILRWMCELGRIDIVYETAILSRYSIQPRTGHLEQLLHIFHYFDKHDNSWLPIDSRKLNINWDGENISDPWERAKFMKEIYPDAIEELPHDMPEPLGESVQINTFVDADHAGDKLTRRSQTGILIFCNMTLINWSSKKQNTVETSTFGSEMVALRNATELIRSLRYKLRSFGVPIDGEANIFCDNDAVVKTTSSADATLKKKHCSVSYHRIRESVSAGIIIILYESTSTNLADLLTKSLNCVTRRELMSGIFA